MKSEKTTPTASIFEKQYLTVSEIRSYRDDRPPDRPQRHPHHRPVPAY